MATWNSRGLRGSALEEFINETCARYREKNLALIQKVPTPITPVRIDKESRHITLAYFEKKSTVDYIGVVQGIPICFDAKECNTDNFSPAEYPCPSGGIHGDFEKQQGIAFLILFSPTGMNSTICPTGRCIASGCGDRTAAGNILSMRN